jgi:hypothetical protein
MASLIQATYYFSVAFQEHVLQCCIVLELRHSAPAYALHRLRLLIPVLGSGPGADTIIWQDPNLVES